MLDADFPLKFQAEINVYHDDGHISVAHIDQVKGSADRPASIEDIENKFKTNTSIRHKASTQNDIIDLMLHGSANLPISKLSDLLAKSWPCLLLTSDEWNTRD